MPTLILTFFILLTSSGCATNFSGVSGYREYVQKQTPLLKTVYLIEAQSDIPRGSRYLNPHYEAIPPGTLYVMVEAENAKSQGIELPPGTPLNIREVVCQSTSGDSFEVQARGKVYSPDLAREVNFFYVYAYEYPCVRRAPWEDEHLPLWRKFDTGKKEWCEKRIAGDSH